MGQNWAYFLSRGSRFQDAADFQNCLIWPWNLAIGQSSRSCAYISFYPTGWNWAYFRSTGSGFWDMGGFSKLPYLGMKLAWPLAKVPEVAHMPSFYPIELKLSLYSLSGQRFLRYGWFSKLPYLGMIFGHWQSSRSCTYTLFLSHWVIIEVIFTLHTGSSFWDTARFSKLPYLGMKLLLWPKFQKFHTYSLNIPESQISLHFAHQLPISKILAIFHFVIGHSIKFLFFLN